MPLKTVQPNVFTESLPAPLKALIEATFPPDSLGIDPSSTVMPVAGAVMGGGRGVLNTLMKLLDNLPSSGGMQVLDDVPMPQGGPLGVDEVEAALGQLRGNLENVPTGKFGSAPQMDAMAPRMPQNRPDLTPPMYGGGPAEFVPPGGEAAFNALRQSKFGPVHGQKNQVRSFLDDLTSEVGHEGVRSLQKAPIPARQVQAPPRVK